MDDAEGTDSGCGGGTAATWAPLVVDGNAARKFTDRSGPAADVPGPPAATGCDGKDCCCAARVVRPMWRGRWLLEMLLVPVLEVLFCRTVSRGSTAPVPPRRLDAEEERVVRTAGGSPEGVVVVTEVARIGGIPRVVVVVVVAAAAVVVVVALVAQLRISRSSVISSPPGKASSPSSTSAYSWSSCSRNGAPKKTSRVGKRFVDNAGAFVALGSVVDRAIVCLDR